MNILIGKTKIMNLALITSLLDSPSQDTAQALLEDLTTVFWIDWRQEDETIPASCEAVLQTGQLSGELVEVSSGEGYEVYIKYKERKVRVPLTYAREDRNITLSTLNEVLAPDYEIRFCHDSSGSDTLAFLPLPMTQWAELERKFGGTVGAHFFSLSEYPSLF